MWRDADGTLQFVYEGIYGDERSRARRLYRRLVVHPQQERKVRWQIEEVQQQDIQTQQEDER